MKAIPIYFSLVLLCSFFTLDARFVPLENIISIARDTFGKPIALEIEEKLLARAKFQNNKVFVDEREATALLNHYFSMFETERPMRRHHIRSKEQKSPTSRTNRMPLDVVMRDIYSLFGQQRQRIVDIESKLLKHVEIDESGELFINENIVSQVINQELTQKRQSLKILDVIPLPGALRQLPLVQLNVNTQKANSCGFHALYNLKAIEDLVLTNQPLSSANVKNISRLYLDGYLAEIGKRESDLIDLAWEDKPAELSQSAGLKHFFLIQYYNPSSPEVSRGHMPAGARFAYNGDRNQFYFDGQEKQAARDFINSVQKNLITPCVLGIPGHYTAFAVMHKPDEQPFIIYMNSISGDGVNSVAMQEGSGEAAVAAYLSNLIKNIR